MTLAIAVLASIGALLQWAAGVRILRTSTRGAFSIVTVALLAFNGLIAAGLALGIGTQTAGQTGLATVSGVTSPLLLASGLLMLRFPHHELWDRRSKALVAVTGLVCSALLVGLVPAWYARYLAPLYYSVLTAPALVGLGLLALALPRALQRCRPESARGVGFLLIAYIPVVAQQAVYYGLELLDPEQLPRILATPVEVVSIVFLVAATAVAGVLLAIPGRAHPAWRRGVLSTLAGAALLTAPLVNLGISREATNAAFVLANVPLFVVRPLSLLAALAPGRVGRTVYQVGAIVTCFTVAKALAALLVGIPFDRLEMADLASFGLALLVLPAALAVPHLLGSHGPTRQTVRPALPRADERLARYLLRQAQAGVERTGKAELTLATGIGENNLAAAVRRLEKGIEAQAAPGTFVREWTIGVRGRKEYGLTPEGVARLEGTRKADASQDGAVPARRETPTPVAGPDAGRGRGAAEPDT